MNVNKVATALEQLISTAEEIMEMPDAEQVYMSWLYGRIDRPIGILTTEEYKKNIEQLLAIKKELEDMFKRSYYCQITAKEAKQYAETLINLCSDEFKTLQQYRYHDIRVDMQYYKAKCVYYTNTDFEKVLRYMIVSCHSVQELSALLSNLQKGSKRNTIGDYDYFTTVKNGYHCLYSRTQNENIGDGVHAVIYQNDERVLKIHRDESPVEKVFKFVSANCKTGLIPEWDEYFYNKLNDMGLIHECEGFDFTGKAPKVLVLSDEIDTDLVLRLKQNGLRSGEISLPVQNNVKFKPDATFYELVTEYVIPYMQDEEVHYQVGDPIDDVVTCPIALEDGRKGQLYPRQQVIAQGIINAIRAGKRRLILNGSMGIGKTFVGAKTALAAIRDIRGSLNGRLAIYCQGTLLRKWKREIEQVAKPLGIKPKFLELNTFADVRDLPKGEPDGLEVLVLSKDRVKRSYLVEMAARYKYNPEKLQLVQAFYEKVYNKFKYSANELIIAEAKNLPINLMKYAAYVIENNTERPVILYKKHFDDTGKVKGYKVVTPSKILKTLYGTSRKAYDFELPVSDWEHFKNVVAEQSAQLIIESSVKNHKYLELHNGLTCPTCGGFIYPREGYVFDEEKCFENLRDKPKNKSQSFSKCKHLIKTDGTPLMRFEVKGIMQGNIGVEFVDDIDAAPYVDADGNPLTGKDLVDAKANRYAGHYTINVRNCNAELWSAVDKKGYRTFNSIKYLQKIRGKGYIDVCIADEAHLYNHESNQGLTYHYLVKNSKVMLNLTGTLTGGKSSDIFYMLYRLFPDKLKRMGYDYRNVNLFIDHYGRKERTIKEEIDAKYNRSGKGRRSVGAWTERPGISPVLYTNFLSGVMVSRNMEDMQLPMPKITFHKHEVEMSPELQRAYNDLKDQFIRFMRENKELPLGGSYLHSLLAYPDYPKQPPIYWCNTALLVAVPQELDVEGRLLPKEQKLIDTVKSELSKGRKVMVYSIYSGEKGVSDRLMEVLRSNGIKAVELKSTVPVEKREEWIEQKDREGYQVLVTNPVNVMTGLNIIQFPTIYFYETGFSTYVLRQSEVRHWRVNQKKPCKVFYSYYSDTLQEDAIKLIGGKKKESLKLEGVFSEDILSAMGEIGDDGSRVLFDVLKGKVKLKEDALDAFGFVGESEGDVAEETASDVDSSSGLYILTEDDVKRLRKGRKKKGEVIEGQLSLFAM